MDTTTLINWGHMETNADQDRFKKLEAQEELKLDDLAFMIGLPADLIKEHLLDDKDRISVKDLQAKTRAMVDEYFKDTP